MKTETFNRTTIGVALLSLVISSLALFLSWSEHTADYRKSVLIRPGMLPLNIKLGSLKFNLDVLNTSKTNLQYYMRVETNMGFIEGGNGRPQLFPFSYESQIVSLSKSDAGSSLYQHDISLDAQPRLADLNSVAYISSAEYFILIKVIDATNGRTLYNSQCFYSFHKEAKRFVLDQPVLDTTGQSEIRQKECRT